jgi:hypothetical protein
MGRLSISDEFTLMLSVGYTERTSVGNTERSSPVCLHSVVLMSVH